MEIHIGEIIKNKLLEAKITQAEIAENIGKSRQAINIALQNKFVSSELIYKISIMLRQNLFSEIAKHFEGENPSEFTPEEFKTFIRLQMKLESFGHDEFGRLAVKYGFAELNDDELKKEILN